MLRVFPTCFYYLFDLRQDAFNKVLDKHEGMETEEDEREVELEVENEEVLFAFS